MTDEQKQIYLTRARKCQRCGGVLISEQGLRDGYGSGCLKKMQEEAANRELLRNQVSLFDENEETKQ